MNNARESADARWMAYVSTESGAAEMFLSDFPAADRKWQISTGGGSQPAWHRDGKELL